MPPKNIYRSRKVVSCKYCFYEKNDECQLRVCPYVAERITAKVINYEKLILEFFKGNQPRLFSTRLRKHCRTYRHFSYLSTSHRKLFEQTRDEIARITYTPVCGADLAILYLSTSDELMSKHIIPLITHAKQLSWRFESMWLFLKEHRWSLLCQRRMKALAPPSLIGWPLQSPSVS